jgi:hypothetical protein
VTGQVRYWDYTPEKMLELLTEMKANGRAICFDSKAGQFLDIDVRIEFYRSLCADIKAMGT